MSEQTQLFSLGLTYWPRRTAFGWWRAFDRGEAREELAHVAALGCDTVRLCLRWEDFQTGPRRINSGALSNLEHVLDSAQGAGLCVVAALFPWRSAARCSCRSGPTAPTRSTSCAARPGWSA